MKLIEQALQTEQNLTPFLGARLNKPYGSKAFKDAIRQLSYALIRNGSDVASFLADFETDAIFDPSVLLKGGNLHDFIHPEYRALADDLFSIRTIGLGTPNATCGEGEFMAVILSKRVGVSKKKGEGDLTVDGHCVEMKGDGIRVFSGLSGKNFRIRTTQLIEEYGLDPFTAAKIGPTFEPWDEGKKEAHCNAQFAKIGLAKSKEFLFRLMNTSGSTFTKHQIDSCFVGGKLKAANMQKEILKSFFASSARKWEALTMINNRTVVVINSDATAFAQLVDDGHIVPAGNYIRLNQPNDIGWYFKTKEAVEEEKAARTAEKLAKKMAKAMKKSKHAI